MGDRHDRPGDGGPDAAGEARERALDRDLDRRLSYDIIEPIGWRVVIRKDDDRRSTKSGIVLPDSHQIPVITGRVVAISSEIEADPDRAIRQYDKVLFDPREAVPVEFESDNKLFVVDIERVMAIFRRRDGDEATPKEAPAGDDPLGEGPSGDDLPDVGGSDDVDDDDIPY